MSRRSIVEELNIFGKPEPAHESDHPFRNLEGCGSLLPLNCDLMDVSGEAID